MSMWEDLKTQYWYFFDEPYLYCWAGIVAAIALWVVVWRIRRSRRPIMLYRSQGGNVEIARQTLRGLIIGASLRVPGIEQAACTYDQRGRKLRVGISIHLAGDARLTVVEEELKKRIRTALQQHVGYEPSDVQPINVRVNKIVGDPSPALEEEYSREEMLLPRYDDDDEKELPEGQKPFERD